jgi:hypothetical protein
MEGKTREESEEERYEKSHIEKEGVEEKEMRVRSELVGVPLLDDLRIPPSVVLLLEAQQSAMTSIADHDPVVVEEKPFLKFPPRPEPIPQLGELISFDKVSSPASPPSLTDP